jgi:DNA-binding transcriptional ArsR family regulator
MPSGECTAEVDDEEYKGKVESLLKGKTMSVYALLLTQGQMGVREISRALRLSSPSLALHHLTKLVDSDLVEKDAHGEYSVKRTVRVGSMSLFVQLGRWLLPRFIFLATMFAVMLVLYTAFFLSWPPEGKDIMFLSVCLVAIVVIIHESRKTWLLKPF